MIAEQLPRDLVHEGHWLKPSQAHLILDFRFGCLHSAAQL
jgi:hypothetical protein